MRSTIALKRRVDVIEHEIGWLSSDRAFEALAAELHGQPAGIVAAVHEALAAAALKTPNADAADTLLRIATDLSPPIAAAIARRLGLDPPTTRPTT